MTNFNIAQARRFWIHVHEGGTLTSVDVGRMVTALEETFQMYVDANEARIDAEAERDALAEKLAKAVAFLQDQTGAEWPYSEDAKDILAELKGQNDE